MRFASRIAKAPPKERKAKAKAKASASPEKALDQSSPSAPSEAVSSTPAS